MGKVTIYEGEIEVWDNGPGSWAEDPNIPDPITITDTLDYRGAGLLVLEITYKGITERASILTGLPRVRILNLNYVTQSKVERQL